MDKKLTLEDVVRLVARLRAAGARVINSRGEDLSAAEIEALLKELPQ